MASPLLCSSWPSLPPTGRGTRPSHSLWRRSWSLAGKRTGNSGFAFDSIFFLNVLTHTDCRRCSPSSRQCIRRELFCDGRINCALPSAKPLDEASCTFTSSSPPESKSEGWKDSSLPTVTGDDGQNNFVSSFIWGLWNKYWVYLIDPNWFHIVICIHIAQYKRCLVLLTSVSPHIRRQPWN